MSFMNPTRIAIGTADGVSVCDHLARSREFVIVEIAGGAVASREVRDARTTARAATTRASSSWRRAARR